MKWNAEEWLEHLYTTLVLSGMVHLMAHAS
jgi:hypothetical protein